MEEGKKVSLNLRFLDFFRFLSSSLDSLSQTLTDVERVETRKYFQDINKFNLLRYKGVFPYSYVNSETVLSENKLPTKADFFDILRGDGICEEEYERAQKIWKTLGDYSDLYIKSDVLLLADIFENIRSNCLQTYKIDPAQYYSSPSLSWYAMLRKMV